MENIWGILGFIFGVLGLLIGSIDLWVDLRDLDQDKERGKKDDNLQNKR